VFSREEVLALVRAAESERDAALYLTAAIPGLRLGELLALRWEHVDFEADTIRVERNYAAGREGTPESGRAVPMMEEVAKALARLGQRYRFTAARDLRLLRRARAPPRLQVAQRSLQGSARPERSCGACASTSCATPFGTHAIRHADAREVMLMLSPEPGDEKLSSPDREALTLTIGG